MSIFLTLLAATPAGAANSWGTDLSDWWWVPSESGWGVNVAHQGDTLFIAIFAHGTDRQPRWYTGALTSLGGSSNYTFTGPVYETTGPYFGGPFDPASVSTLPVGIATMQFTSISTGAQLSYTVGDAKVFKVLERMTFRKNNLAGNFLGAVVGTASGCGPSSGNFALNSQFTVTHADPSISIAVSFSNGSACTFAGTYAQAGRMGSMTGTISCSSGARASFEAYEIESSYRGFMLRYDANWGGGCTETASLGGVR